MSLQTEINRQKTQKSRGSDEAQIRLLLEDYVQACRNGDLEKIMSFFAEDVIAYDMPPPLQFQEKSAYRASWEKWFTSAFEFPVTFEIRDLKIFVAGDVGFSCNLLRNAGTLKKGGEKVDSWLRHTCGLQKRNGQWVIVHEHTSAPVGEDGKALMSLAPNSKILH
jgi:ketosteroid isomerase-like protein